MKGKLYLIPSTLGGPVVEAVIPRGTLEVIEKLDTFVVEELRSARRYLSGAGKKGEISSLSFHLLNEHSREEELEPLIELLLSGLSMGVISEAGLPAVADPGANLVRRAQQCDIEVIPLVGPSSILLALMASGKNGQNFSFVGYLPKERKERRRSIVKLERESSRSSQIIIETPYRNDALLEDLLELCSPQTVITIACEVTTEGGFVKSKSVEEWRKNPISLHKRPSVFII